MSLMPNAIHLKTSVLKVLFFSFFFCRSIAQAEKVGADGKLWQMSKFQKVPSHLDTFRGSAKSSESDPYRYSGKYR